MSMFVYWLALKASDGWSEKCPEYYRKQSFLFRWPVSSTEKAQKRCALGKLYPERLLSRSTRHSLKCHTGIESFVGDLKLPDAIWSSVSLQLVGFCGSVLPLRLPWLCSRAPSVLVLHSLALTAENSRFLAHHFLPWFGSLQALTQSSVSLYSAMGRLGQCRTLCLIWNKTVRWGRSQTLLCLNQCVHC